MLRLAFIRRMTEQEMQDIVAFLLTLTEEEFLNNPAFKP